MSGERFPSREVSRAASDDAAIGEAAVDWAIGAGAAQRVTSELGAAVAKHRARRRRTTSLAGIAAALVLGFVSWSWITRAPAPQATVARSWPEARSLPDGSTVELKEGAEIAVQFERELRRVTLLRGEAHFDVVPDPARPFVVRAGGVVARALGTTFAVQLSEAEVEVLVTEGLVAVDVDRGAAATPRAVPTHAAPGGAVVPSSAALIDAGHRLLVPRATTRITARPESVSSREVREKLAWRKVRFEFSGTPLSEVVAMFQRHSGIHIVLAEPSLGRLQVSGVLRGDSAESLLRLLELEFGLKTETRDDQSILLRRP